MKKNAVRRRSGIERSNDKWIYLFLLPSCLIFAVFYAVPIVTVFYTSLCRWDGFNAPVFIGFANYVKMFRSETFLLALRNLALWSVIAITLHVGFGVLVALVLYRHPPGWKLTRNVFMIPNVISAAAWALIYKFIFNNDIGILNNLIRLFVPSFQVQWFYTSPYAFWAVTFTWLFYAVIVTLIVLNDLYAIPAEVNEAARIDGASSWQTTWHIHLPMCRNSIGTAVICSVTSRIAMYESIALTTAGGPGDDTMNLPIILVRSILDMNYGYANANGVIMFIMGLITLWVVNRLFRMNETVL